MKKHLLFFYLLTLIFSGVTRLCAQDSTIVGPGVVYFHDEIIEGGPWNFDILKIDLRNPNIQFETIKAEDNLFSFERMSSAAARYNKEGHKVVGAINGDFYNVSTGEPTNIQVINGQMIYPPVDRVAFAMDEFKKPLIEIFDYKASIQIGNNPGASIDIFNQAYVAGKSAIYNSFYGPRTKTPKGVTEITVTPVTDWITNDTMKCVVTKSDTTGNVTLSRTTAVISGQSEFAQYLKMASIGDTIKICLKIKPSLSKITQAIGGNVRLVKDGVPHSDNGDRHPRTAVGFTRDSMTVYLITVDGRQPDWSVGMSYYELGNYMKSKWNVYQGINLDGGGSTTMVVRGNVMNHPSDGGGERYVANGMFVISTAPTGPLSIIKIIPGKVFLINGASKKFTVNGYDEFYNPLSTAGLKVDWSCDNRTGVIDSLGNLTTTAASVNGYVYAQIGSIRDSVLIQISSVTKIILTPDPIVLQIGQVQKISAKSFDAYGNQVVIPDTAYEWNVAGNVGSITDDGMFTAETSGEGKIIVKYKNAVDTIDAKVGVDQYVLIDDFSGSSTYSITGTKVDLTLSTFSFDHTKYVSVPMSGKLNYSLMTGGTSTLNLNCNVPMSGTPTALGIYVYGDGKQHWLRAEIKDANGSKFLLNITPEKPGVDWTDEWRYLEVNFVDAIPSWANPSAKLTFPVSLIRIYMAEPNDQKKDSGILYFDDLKIHFITTTSVNGESSALPDQFELKQNYPNPFNPGTLIEYSVPKYSNVELNIYNILGAKVESLVKGIHSPGRYKVNWDAGKYASGVYIYQLISENSTMVKKMQLIK